MDAEWTRGIKQFHRLRVLTLYTLIKLKIAIAQQSILRD